MEFFSQPHIFLEAPEFRIVQTAISGTAPLSNPDIPMPSLRPDNQAIFASPESSISIHIHDIQGKEGIIEIVRGGHYITEQFTTGTRELLAYMAHKYVQNTQQPNPEKIPLVKYGTILNDVWGGGKLTKWTISKARERANQQLGAEYIKMIKEKGLYFDPNPEK